MAREDIGSVAAGNIARDAARNLAGDVTAGDATAEDVAVNSSSADDSSVDSSSAGDTTGNPVSDSVLSAFLLGTYTPKIDVKGRLALPAKFRTQLQLGGGFVMARGQEHCVYLLPITEFTRMASQIQRASIGDKKTRDYLRVFLSGTLEGQVDKQGRVIVPPMLRAYASLGDDIVVIGVGTRAEIWDARAWGEYLESQEEGYSMISDDILPPLGA